MDSHQDKINMTRALEALSPYLENPRRIVIRNEVFMIVAAATLFLQLMLGPWRRRSGHLFVQGTLWVAYTGSFPLITYTLGQMVTSPVKNMMYPIWAVILLWASGCANAFTAYNIEDNKPWKRNLFELLQYLVYVVVILSLIASDQAVSSQYTFFLLVMLSTMVPLANIYRVVAGWMVTNSTPIKKVADYMRAQVRVNTRSRAAQEETFTMNNCKYLVWHSFMGPAYRGCESGGITIGAIWGMAIDDDSLLKKQLRDVCLSYALSHLLRRRYFEMDCAEAGLPETLKFALEGLLPEEDQVNHYSGAFHVIEVELGFLYDLFFTKHAALFSLQGNNFDILVVIKLILTSVAIVLLIWCPPNVNALDPIIEVGTRRVDVTVTVVIMGALLLFEVLQAILYLTSDWAAVSFICSYARGNTSKLIQFLSRFIKFYNFIGRRINLFGYWQNKMGQSSVIGGNLLVNWHYVSTCSEGIKIMMAFQSILYKLIYSMVFSMKNFVVIPDLVKSQIVSCLRTYGHGGGPLTNGKAALERNDVLGEFSSTLENDSQITVMLIWHIATEYCNISSSDGAEEGLHQSDAQKVATTLSKYCAYLMYFVPELLAENSTDTLFLVHDLLKKVQSALGGDKPTKDRLLRVVIEGSESIRTPNSIFMKGLKLGRELEVKDVDLRWKVMAEFWAETIIYIAPSDKAAEHMERLAQGGEFLTHVWALLTHAGIVKRDQMMQTSEDRV